MDRPYVIIYSGRKMIAYGPFPNEEAAKRASYFNQPVSVNDARRFDRFPFKVQWYGDEELKHVQASPEEFDRSSVEIRSAKMSVHPSWRSLFKKHFPGKNLRREFDAWWDGKIKGRW